MVVFAAYIAVAFGLGGSRLLDAFSSWVAIALVLGAAGLLAARGFAGRRRARAVARVRGRRGAVGRRRADLRDRILRGPGPRALPVRGRRVLARRLCRDGGRHRARAAGAPAAGVPPDDVARRGDRRDDDRRADGDDRLRPRARRHRRQTLQVATDLAYPLADLGLLALVATLLALTGWRPGSAGRCSRSRSRCRRSPTCSTRARSRSARTARHAARARVAGRDAAARLRRLAPARPPPRSGVPLARVFVFPAVFTPLGARRPRLRPLPRHQHARPSCSPRPRSPCPSRGWRCPSSTTCGCCGAPGATRSPTR